MNGVFIINVQGEIEPNGCFRVSRVRAKFIEKMIDRFDGLPFIYYTGDIFRYIKIFR